MLGDAFRNRLALDDLPLRLDRVDPIIAHRRSLNSQGACVQFLNSHSRRRRVQADGARGPPRREPHNERQHDNKRPPAMTQGGDEIAQRERTVHRRAWHAVLTLLDHRLAHMHLSGSGLRSPH
jgi:hypothetical protein